MNNNNEFGKYLKTIREKNGYSLRELGRISSITPYYISYLENGKKTNPSIEIMAKLFKALNMSKLEIERFLDLYAKVNNCVSYDIVDFIMENDDIREYIRSKRDEPDSSPGWDDFIKKIYNGNH